ncbi:cytochrome C [Rhizobium sp. Leaf384]|uniref:c-type cytochrome n=1 Tax=unclassified Rhizobium TaxID=2613769 RepID=UPI00071422E2|nr:MULTISPECIES: cytochrome c family protein [unclassified Rhizobium]KQR72883.1 cytochrome C [Rhizobium sp. Leaf341]KQS75525.1 cytochrome C [Rhizobium sp. Leaf384]KQS75774.1 cytochrome C [Rhizobium sp. Leaf383]
MRPVWISLCLAALLQASCADAEDIDHGRRIFQTCASCHVVDAETNKYGPYLKGVVGRKAGAVPDFRYSQAMTDAGNSGLVWDDEALAAFLYSPKRKVPGTSMRFWGLWSESEIRDVIAYLKTFP